MADNDTNYLNNSSCPELTAKPSEYSEITKWIALLEMIGIITVNLTVIVLLARQNKQNRMAFFVQHLAVADLCVGLLYVMPECVFDRFLMNWEKYSCLILYGYCANMTILASTFLIVVLTIDRMFVIVHPLASSTRGSKYRIGLVSGAWFVAIMLAIPYACHAELIWRNGRHICWHNYGKGIYAVVIAEVVINVLIPVCIITICYAWIILVIWRRERMGFTGPHKTCKGKSGTVTFSNMPSTRPSNIYCTKTKTIKLLLVIVLVYIISWTPLNVAQVMNTFDYMDVGSVFVFLHVLAPINSLMNPLVFLLFNTQMFRKDRRGHSDCTHCDHA